MKLAEIYARLKKDIRSVEQALEEQITIPDRLLNDASLHLLKAGGKRLRPVFVLLAGEFGDYHLERLKHIAVPLELIHMATLVHDDVIDDADTRRGQYTVRSKWDNRIAMYTGDYILGKALSMITQLKDERIHQILSRAIVQMTIGEMEQIRLFYHADQTVRDYLLRIRRKTALLIAVSCQLGAIAAGASDDITRRLYRFGYNAGMAFQITDDILDICGTEKQLGKPPGSDMRQGNITLPVIYALQDQSVRDEILEEIERFRVTEGLTDSSRFLSLIHQSDGIERAKQLADKYIQKSIDALQELPDIQAKDNLMEIARFIGVRSN